MGRLQKVQTETSSSGLLISALRCFDAVNLERTSSLARETTMYYVKRVSSHCLRLCLRHCGRHRWSRIRMCLRLCLHLMGYVIRLSFSAYSQLHDPFSHMDISCL